MHKGLIEDLKHQLLCGMMFYLTSFTFHLISYFSVFPWLSSTAQCMPSLFSLSDPMSKQTLLSSCFPSLLSKTSIIPCAQMSPGLASISSPTQSHPLLLPAPALQSVSASSTLQAPLRPRDGCANSWLETTFFILTQP